MLHRVTGEAIYLEQARATADAALAWYGARGYQGQPAIFVAIFFRNLLQLAALAGSLSTDSPDYRAAQTGSPSTGSTSADSTSADSPSIGSPAYRKAMLAYADRAWDNPAIHDPATDLFRFDGPKTPCTLLDQAAMVQMYALAAWPESQYGLLA
jgi:hypothetical protein